MAEKDTVRPPRSGMRKWPQNGHLRTRNRERFLAVDGRYRKYSGQLVRSAFTRMISSLKYCRGLCRPTRLHERPCSSGWLVPPRESEKFVRNRLPHAIDAALVWRLDRWARSVTDLLATLLEPESFWGPISWQEICTKGELWPIAETRSRAGHVSEGRIQAKFTTCAREEC